MEKKLNTIMLVQLSDFEHVFSALDHIIIKLVPERDGGPSGTGKLGDRT
jgi:hypothetical protein